MQIVLGFITALRFPLLLLSILGGVVSGVWLAILGEWAIIGAGLVLYVVSSFLLGLALMPSMLLVLPLAYFAGRNKVFAPVFFGALDTVYILTLVTVWCCGILFFFIEDATAASFVPRLIWSYGAATGPWADMNSRSRSAEGNSFASSMALFLAQLAYLLIMVLLIFLTMTKTQVILVFAGFMLVGLAIQIVFSTMVHLEEKRLSSLSNDVFDEQ